MRGRVCCFVGEVRFLTSEDVSRDYGLGQEGERNLLDPDQDLLQEAREEFFDENKPFPMPGKEFFVSVEAGEVIGWMPGRNIYFPGEGADQLNEISILPENHDGSTEASPAATVQILRSLLPGPAPPRLGCWYSPIMEHDRVCFPA